MRRGAWRPTARRWRRSTARPAATTGRTTPTGLSDAPLEDWHGVEVTDGRVTGLRLGGWDDTARDFVGNGLTGSLSPELGSLSQLRWLGIGGNSGLTGPIPAELGNLTSLESLSLEGELVDGLDPRRVGASDRQS